MPRLALPSIERIPGGRGFASLSRRVRTLSVAGGLFLVMFILTLALPVPYVILSPGPTCNTLGTDAGANCVGGSGSQIVVIKGHAINKTSGNLNLTTVSESGDKVTAFQAFVGWLKHDQVVVPYSSVNPPGTSEKQTQQQNAADFAQSQDSATAAAACRLGYPSTKVEVLDVVSDAASNGQLQASDDITSVNATSIASQPQLIAALAKVKAGQKVEVGIERGGKKLTEAIKLGPPVKGRTGGSLGISGTNVCPLPFTVDLGLGNRIGGPSAGLMFALGIIDKVGKQDLTGGKFIAGTGTIDDAGRVGPIGGIPLKMIAARNAGATVFLAPAGNCGQVRDSTPPGLRIVRVDTLAGAVQGLLKIKEGQSVPSC